MSRLKSARLGGFSFSNDTASFESSPRIFSSVAGDSSRDASGCGKRTEANTEPSQGIGVAAWSGKYSRGVRVGHVVDRFWRTKWIACSPGGLAESRETGPNWGNA